jgi:gliding motility-associated-like protein
MQATIVQAIAPCDASTYTQIGSCEFAAAGNFVLSATGLLPNTTYYIVVNGATNAPATIPAQATMDISVSGNGVQRIPPGLALFVPSNLICAGEPQLFSAYAGDCPDTTDYYWYINDQLVAVTQSNDFETSALKNGDVLSVTTTCFEYCIIEIADTSAPFAVVTITVDAGPDFTINAGGSVVLQGSTSESSYFWTPSFTLSNPNLLSPIAQPDETTYYYLSATNGACTVTDEAVVYVNDKLSITNTFTPNGDGYNDTWEIPSLEQYSNCFIEIYDRWGQSIFQTTGYNAKKAWDGKHKGKLLEAGVYFYVIEVRDPDFTEPIRGSLTMIR